VQGVIEAALAKMHGRFVPLFAAGRTDAGVHARGQVANFYTDIRSIEASRFVPALNKLIPRSVRVLESVEAAFDFHSRFDARLRRYRYFIATGRRVDPFRLRYAHQLNRVPELSVLNRLASALLGERDFSALSSARDPSLSKKRLVLESSFRWEDGLLVYEIAANAFMLRMVRSIVGSLLEWEAVASGPELLAEALRTGDRGLAGATAPARGLFFWNAEYWPEPRKPGRGAYWSRLGERPDATDADEEGEEEAVEGAETASPALPDRPVEPGPVLAGGTGKARLVPGIGYIKE